MATAETTPFGPPTVELRGLTSGGGAPNADWYGLKPLFVPLAIIYLNTFNSAATAFALCVAMIVAAVVIEVYYWRFRIGPANRALGVIVSKLAANTDTPGSEAALTDIDKTMTTFPLLKRSWSLYRASLATRPDGQISATIAPARYLDKKALELAGLRLRLFRELPHDFVGLGLVLTFLGLIAGLYFASESMMSASLGDARNALVMLLHAATFKFLTSITGIGLSLVLSWWHNIILDRLDQKLSDLQYLVELKVPLTHGTDGIVKAA